MVDAFACTTSIQTGENFDALFQKGSFTGSTPTQHLTSDNTEGDVLLLVGYSGAGAVVPGTLTWHALTPGHALQAFWAVSTDDRQTVDVDFPAGDKGAARLISFGSDFRGAYDGVLDIAPYADSASHIVSIPSYATPSNDSIHRLVIGQQSLSPVGPPTITYDCARNGLSPWYSQAGAFTPGADAYLALPDSTFDAGTWDLRIRDWDVPGFVQLFPSIRPNSGWHAGNAAMGS